jgi:alpha-2-macroglobulin
MLRACARVVALLVPFASAALAAEPPPAAVANVEVVAERDAPQICITFNGRLERYWPGFYRSFVTVDPGEGASVAVRDRTLCVEGLKHNRAYTITLKSGLPLADGRSLSEETIALDVPNRAPALAFKGAGYALSRLGEEGLALRSINLDRVRLQVLRMDDPALVEKVYFGRVSRQLPEAEIGELVERSAREVWRGEMALADSRNQPVQTAFPLDAILGKLEPGVYIATAEGDAGAEPLKAAQWFVVSDLGLNTVLGADGLLTFARRIHGSEPAAGVELRLLSATGKEVAKTTTAADGLARFPAEVMGGSGEDRPQAVFARDDANVALLDLSAPNPETAETGPLLPPADPVTAHLYATRGLYRPGESVDLIALLRDSAGNAASSGGPLTVEIKRPDGLTVQRLDAADTGAAGYPARVVLPRSAMSGRWTASARRGDGPVLGTTSFLVDDFMPPRFGITLGADRKAVGRDGVVALTVAADRIAGTPAAFLPGELSATVRAAPVPFTKFADYRFGLVQETLEPQAKALPGFTTDWAGRAKAELALTGLPESSHALEVAVRAALVDLGGRRVEGELVLPLEPPPLSIGIRPRFAAEALPEGASAGFDVIAVDAEGTPVDRPGLSYELIEEETSYEWFEAEGRWDYRGEVRDRRVTGGVLDAKAEAPVALEEPVSAGRYRLDVFDKATGASSSVRFSAGWWLSPAEPVKADKVDVTVMLPSYKGGDTAQVFVQPPYRSLVLVTVADRRVRAAQTREIGPEGAFLDIPVDPSWIGGVNVIATAYAKPDAQNHGENRRAVGESWLSVTPSDRTLDVRVAVAETAAAGATVSAEVSVGGAPAGTPAYVTLAAVDDAVQRLTGFAPFDPASALFGTRAPAVEVRDLEGRLLAKPVPAGETVAPPPALRPVPFGLVPSRRAPVTTLFSGVLTVGEGGRVTVPLPLPNAAARLRLTAIAWTAAQVGRGESWLKVSEAAAAELTAPAALTLGDTAEASLTMMSLAETEGNFRVEARAEGSVGTAAPATEVRLLPRQRTTVRVPLDAAGRGSGRLTISIATPDGSTVVRSAGITVNPPQAPLIRSAGTTLSRDGGPFRPAGELTAGMTATFLAVSAGPAAGLDVPGLLASLRKTTAPGADAAAARLLSLVTMGDTGTALGLWPRETAEAAIHAALDTLLACQRADGAFAAFGPKGEADGWLTAFAVDVLDRARGTGIAVPDPVFHAGVQALRASLDNTWVAPGDLPARAYALFVLARLKAVDLDSVKHFREAYGEQLPTDLARVQVAAAGALLGEEPAADLYGKVTAVRVVDAGLNDYGSTARDEAAMLVLMAEGKAPAEALRNAAAALTRGHAAPDAASEQERAWTLAAARVLGGSADVLKVRIGEETVEQAGAFYRALPLDRPVELVAGAETPVPVLVTAIGAPIGEPRAFENGLTVSRRVFAMDGQPVDPAHALRNASYVVLVEGRATDGAARSRVLLVDDIPGGFDIETVRHAGSAALGGLSWLGDLSPVRWWSRTRDSRVEAVVELTPAAPHFRLAYIVRAVAAGHYHAPGVRLTDLDRPARAAMSESSKVTVTGE